MKYLLDTNVIVAMTVDEDSSVIRHAGECEVGDMVTSSIALAEIALGTKRGSPPTMEALEAFVEEVSVLDFDYKAALTYALLPFKRGRFDRLIAAHAVANDLIVVTRNAKDFTDVPGLRIEDWTS